MNHVYHASKVQGLKTIEPRVSTHGQSWVYAFSKSEDCLMILGPGGDLINQIGFHNGMRYIAERFAGALEYVYKNASGSIYALDETDFKTDQTDFKAEVVCDHECAVIEETKIDNALENILALELKGELKIYRYPDLPEWLPHDKSDLINKAVEWAKHTPKERIVKSMEKYHPDILEQVKKRFNEPV